MTSFQRENKTLLITGAGGFVGTNLRKMCSARDVKYFTLRRGDQSKAINEVSATELVGRGIDVTIHLAGRAHILSDSSPDPGKAFYDANVRHTQMVAKATVEANIRRFIFISTVGVYGLQHTAEAIDEEFLQIQWSRMPSQS